MTENNEKIASLIAEQAGVKPSEGITVKESCEVRPNRCDTRSSEVLKKKRKKRKISNKSRAINYRKKK